MISPRRAVKESPHPQGRHSDSYAGRPGRTVRAARPARRPPRCMRCPVMWNTMSSSVSLHGAGVHGLAASHHHGRVADLEHRASVGDQHHRHAPVRSSPDLNNTPRLVQAASPRPAAQAQGCAKALAISSCVERTERSRAGRRRSGSEPSARARTQPFRLSSRPGNRGNRAKEVLLPPSSWPPGSGPGRPWRASARRPCRNGWTPASVGEHLPPLVDEAGQHMCYRWIAGPAPPGP